MRHLNKFFKGQRGFTLLEILIAITISGVLCAGITATIVQIFNENARATRNMQVVQNLENAGYWINRDMLMVQSVAAPTGFPLVVKWQDCEFEESNNYQGNTYLVSYSLADGKLQRSLKINSGTPIQTVVANYIDDDVTKTFYQYDETSRTMTFTVTANVNSTSETRVYQVKLRSDANS